MAPRTKKLIGVVGILIWLAVYAFIVMRAAIAILPGAGWLVELVFYAVAGLAWIIPIGLALPWMHREPKARPPT
jgi:hypothetical protein